LVLANPADADAGSVLAFVRNPRPPGPSLVIVLVLMSIGTLLTGFTVGFSLTCPARRPRWLVGGS